MSSFSPFFGLSRCAVHDSVNYEFELGQKKFGEKLRLYDLVAYSKNHYAFLFDKP